MDMTAGSGPVARRGISRQDPAWIDRYWQSITIACQGIVAIDSGNSRSINDQATALAEAANRAIRTRKCESASVDHSGTCESFHSSQVHHPCAVIRDGARA